jgi:glyoxylase-like metal-dependent hydrolase (beta-lactamase superfamily II)
MRQVVPDVYLIEGLGGPNVYLLVSGNGLTLVDSGPPGRADRIVAQMQESGYALSELRSVVLTHWHGDHTGSAAGLARRSGAQVIAHRNEAPTIERTRPAASASPVQRLLNELMEWVLLRREPCRVDRQVEDGDVIEALGGTQVLHTPGHSPGSLCLYQPERQILFTGDTVFNVHPLTGRRGLGRHMRFLAFDKAQARVSAARLSELAIDVLCCGHGEPVLEGASDKLKAMLSGEKS